MIHLAVHTAVNHQFSLFLLHALVAIALVIEQWDIDWTEVVSRAQQWELKTVVWSILYLLRQLLNSNIPDDVIDVELAPGHMRQFLILRILTPERILSKYDFRLNLHRFFILLLLIDQSRRLIPLIYHMFRSFNPRWRDHQQN